MGERWKGSGGKGGERVRNLDVMKCITCKMARFSCSQSKPFEVACVSPQK